MLGLEKLLRSFNERKSPTILSGEIDADDSSRVQQIQVYWNFYKGYHWELIPANDKPAVTTNYCRIICDKMVSFELGNGFTFMLNKDLNGVPVTASGKSLFEFLTYVWKDNKLLQFAIEMGLMKSVTGEAWVQVRNHTPEELYDPYNKYPDGRIAVTVLASDTVFPEFDPHDKDVLVKLSVIYQIEKPNTNITGKRNFKKILYKQIWTREEIVEYEDAQEINRYENKYNLIPFIQIKNLSIPAEEHGRSDLEDVIPLNTEYNLKSSNISEIIDYHASPVTVVYGAKVGNLEKGANKMWGGLPANAKIENLEMKSDLSLSQAYLDVLKESICEVSGVPEACLGGKQAISNTSGVALQYANLPLIEKTRVKKDLTKKGLEVLNQLIIFIAMQEGYITKPDTFSFAEFAWNEVSIPDTLPKDALIEVQQIQAEMKAGLTDRESAMKQLGKEDISTLIAKIDRDIEVYPEFYGREAPQINSGLTNSPVPKEEIQN